MSKKNIHIVPHGDEWAVKKTGSERATKVTETKKEAENIGRGIAKNQGVELVIHKKDGTIQDKDSYGKDLCPPKDKKY